MTCFISHDREVHLWQEPCGSGEIFCGGTVSDSKDSQGDVCSAQTTGCKYRGDGRYTGVFPWIKNLLNCQFFTPCDAHRHHKKNECTFFCTECGDLSGELCQHCLPSHANHEVIQIRRYVYCDVVRTQDITQYVDVSGVQTYIINQAKVVFLNNRPQSKLCKATCGEVCLTCHRSLREPFRYCSLACKVLALEAEYRLEHQDGGDDDHETLWPCPKRQRRNEGHSLKSVPAASLLLAVKKSSSDSEDTKVDLGGTHRKINNKRKQGCPRRSPLD